MTVGSISAAASTLNVPGGLSGACDKDCIFRCEVSNGNLHDWKQARRQDPLRPTELRDLREILSLAKADTDFDASSFFDRIPIMVKKRHFWGVLEVSTDVYDQLMAMANDDLIEVGSVPKGKKSSLTRLSDVVERGAGFVDKRRGRAFARASEADGGLAD